jgi:hypothetical protein
VALFVASQIFAPYQSALTVAPETWALAIMDSLGNVWISNSAVISVPCPTEDATQDYGDLTPDLDHVSVTELNSDGNPVGTQPYKGGGIEIPWESRSTATTTSGSLTSAVSG